MRDYVQAVVGRYRDSPAIWAWEFGNEFRLQIDLPGPTEGVPAAAPQAGTPATRTARDKLHRPAVECAQREFARLVRQIDPYRVLVTGDALPRCCAYHLHTKRAWDHDTPAQWAAMLLRDNPDPFDTLSIHIYPLNDREYFEPRASLPDLLRVCQDVATAAGKPLFVGEFGASRELGADRARHYVAGMLDAIVDLRIPLAALWVYDLPSQDDSYNVTPGNDRAWMLDAIGQTNRRMQGDASSTPAATRPASR
jgi:endo-1,4-beta-mannosidase